MGIKLYPYTATDTQAPSTTLSSASIINLNTKLSDFTYAKDATSATQDAVYYSKTYNWAPGTPSFGTNECYITNYLPFSIIVVVSEGVLVMKRIELASGESYTYTTSAAELGFTVYTKPVQVFAQAT